MSTRESILIDDDVISDLKEKVKLNTDAISVIPAGYIKVELDSMGKLSAPKTLHFRNYSMEEAIELSSINEDKFIDVLISCLNRMVLEKFDCADLHDEELKEILMTIYCTFWSKTLEGYKYYVDDKLEGDALYADTNIDDAILEIQKLGTLPINKDFKEPIKIELDGITVKFRLARIKDIIVSRNYIEKKYFETERALSDLTNKYIKDNYSVTYDEKQKIEAFQNEKGRELIKVIQSNLLLEINNKKLNTLEEKLDEYNNVTIQHWQKLNNFIENDLKFGINSEVTFFSLKAKKNVIRRFQFQSMDFIPPVGIYTDTGATLSFGD